MDYFLFLASWCFGFFVGILITMARYNKQMQVFNKELKSINLTLRGKLK
jgi:hypothetical protein